MALRHPTLTRIASSTFCRRRSFSSATTKPPIQLDYFTKTSPEQNKEASTTLHLFSWGRGPYGQLGGGLEKVRIYPSPVATLTLPSDYSLCNRESTLSNCSTKCQVEVGISCGLLHSGLVVDGELWVWGRGESGRLGLGHDNSVFVPTRNPNLEGVSIKSIALGGLHSVALDSSGRVFTWGYGEFGALGHSVYDEELLPKLVEGSWDGEIHHIATSGTHTAAITESGKLYIWGQDDGDGRLGLGPFAGCNSTPTEVKALPVPVAAVSCGGFFTMALTVDGQLWNWGANANCELGRGDKIGGWKPQTVPSLKDVQIIQIASGEFHSLALTEKGEVLSWGHGGKGQLGNSSLHSRKVPEPVEALANETVTYIACGGSSSAAVTDKGKLYMWGNAVDSQLGVPGLPEIQSSPIEVKFLSEDDELVDHRVLSVDVGASHAMCLVSRSAH